MAVTFKGEYVIRIPFDINDSVYRYVFYRKPIHTRLTLLLLIKCRLFNVVFNNFQGTSKWFKFVQMLSECLTAWIRMSRRVS